MTCSPRTISPLNSNLIEQNQNLGGLRFGIDGEGNYGYFGADGSLIPFSQGYAYVCYLTSEAITGGKHLHLKSFDLKNSANNNSNIASGVAHANAASLSLSMEHGSLYAYGYANNSPAPYVSFTANKALKVDVIANGTFVKNVSLSSGQVYQCNYDLIVLIP